MFSELVTIKQRLEDLTPKKEVKDLIIPVEGSAVQAHARQLSSQLRLRSDAQLSGALSVGAVALLSQVRLKPDLKISQVSPFGSEVAEKCKLLRLHLRPKTLASASTQYHCLAAHHGVGIHQLLVYTVIDRLNSLQPSPCLFDPEFQSTCPGPSFVQASACHTCSCKFCSGMAPHAQRLAPM